MHLDMAGNAQRLHVLPLVSIRVALGQVMVRLPGRTALAALAFGMRVQE